MKSRYSLILGLIVLVTLTLTGCGSKDPEVQGVSNPACRKLALTADPNEIAALLKECPDGLPEGFKASKKKEW